MDLEKKESYLNTFKRTYFSGTYGTEKGNKILEKKCEILELEKDACKDIEDKQLAKYNQFLDLLSVIYEDSDQLTEDEKEEVAEYQKDLKLTNEEAEKLTLQFLSQSVEPMNIKNDNVAINEIKNSEEPISKDKAKDEVDAVVEEKEKCQDDIENYYIKNITDTDYQIKIPIIKKGDLFYYRYFAYAYNAKKKFLENYYSFNSLESYNSKKLLNLFCESFDDFFTFNHSFLVKTIKLYNVSKTDLYDFFDLNEFIRICQVFQEITEDINTQVEIQKFERKASRGSSSTVAVGNLGFMAAVGAAKGLGKISSSISDSIANHKFADSINQQVLEKIKSSANLFEDIINEGLLNLYDNLSTDGTVFRKYNNIVSDINSAQAIIDNYELYDDDICIERILEAITLDPYNSEAYDILVGEMYEDNYKGMIDILETAIEWELDDNTRSEFQNDLYELKCEYYENEWENLNENGYAYDTHSEYLTKLKTYLELDEEDIYEIEKQKRIDFFKKAYEGLPLLNCNQLQEELVKLIQYYNISPLTILETEMIFNNKLDNDKLIELFAFDIHCIDKEEIIQFNKLKESYYSQVWEKLNRYNYAYDTHSTFLLNLQKRLDFNKEIINEIETPFRLVYYNKSLRSLSLDSDINLLKGKLKNLAEYYKVPVENILEAEIDHFKMLISEDIEIPNELKDKFYHIELSNYAYKQLHKDYLVQELTKIRDRYSISRYNAYLSEKQVFGNSISIPDKEYNFVEYALKCYENTNGFGKRFWSKNQTIPGDKLNSVMEGYLKNIDKDEIVLFLFDNTFFGSAKDGFTMTNKKIYCKEFTIAYEDIIKISFDDSYLELIADNQTRKTHCAFLDNRTEFIRFMEQLVFEYILSPSPKKASEEVSSNKNNELNQADAISQNSEETPSSSLDQKRKEYLNEEINKLYKAIVKANSSSIGMLQTIKPQKLMRFIQNYNKKLGILIDQQYVLAFYDDTITCNGDKGFVVTYDGIYANMMNAKGFFRFSDMIEEPTYESIFNCKIFLYNNTGKQELYCTGTNGPELLFKLIKLLYDFQ